MPTKIGFVGLGRMGKPIAVNLLAAGFDVMVFDVHEEPLHELTRLGAARAAGLPDVAQHSEIMALAVVDDAQVESVVLSQGGLLQDSRPGSVLLIHSTVLPATVHKLARAAGQRGVGVLDAPVSGGEDGARERQLCYMVGGEKEIVERCRPVMEASAAHIFHIGGLGSGAIAKMILQVVVCINMLGAQEAELLAQKCGLDFAALQKVLHVSSGQSFVSDHWLERFKRPQDPLPIRLRRTEVFSESLAPALRTAADLGLSLPGAAFVQQILHRIMGLENSGPA